MFVALLCFVLCSCALLVGASGGGGLGFAGFWVGVRAVLCLLSRC